MSTDQLPDGVRRGVRLCEEYEHGPTEDCTFVTGHGRVREMWAVVRRDGSAQAAFSSENLAKYLALNSDGDSVRRVIVIEMDNAATPQKGHQP